MIWSFDRLCSIIQKCAICDCSRYILPSRVLVFILCAFKLPRKIIILKISNYSHNNSFQLKYFFLASKIIFKNKFTRRMYKKIGDLITVSKIHPWNSPLWAFTNSERPNNFRLYSDRFAREFGRSQAIRNLC